MKIISKSIISGPEGLETIKALSQQGVLVVPKLQGRKADTYELPGLREVENRLVGKDALCISWKPRHSLGKCRFLQIFII